MSANPELYPSTSSEQLVRKREVIEKSLVGEGIFISRRFYPIHKAHPKIEHLEFFISPNFEEEYQEHHMQELFKRAKEAVPFAPSRYESLIRDNDGYRTGALEYDEICLPEIGFSESTSLRPLPFLWSEYIGKLYRLDRDLGTSKRYKVDYALLRRFIERSTTPQEAAESTVRVFPKTIRVSNSYL